MHTFKRQIEQANMTAGQTDTRAILHVHVDRHAYIIVHIHTISTIEQNPLPNPATTYLVVTMRACTPMHVHNMLCARSPVTHAHCDTHINTQASAKMQLLIRNEHELKFHPSIHPSSRTSTRLHAVSVHELIYVIQFNFRLQAAT